MAYAAPQHGWSNSASMPCWCSSTHLSWSARGGGSAATGNQGFGGRAALGYGPAGDSLRRPVWLGKDYYQAAAPGRQRSAGHLAHPLAARRARGGAAGVGGAGGGVRGVMEVVAQAFD